MNKNEYLDLEIIDNGLSFEGIAKKDGKVIFVNSYIKGKDKPFKHQNIIINPKEN